MDSKRLSRRQVLKLVVTGVGVGTLGSFLDACARAVAPATSLATTVPTTPVPAAGESPIAPGVGTGKGAATAPPAVSGQVAITPNADFYTVAFRSDKPSVPSEWKLKIDGNVDKPLTLTLDDIRAMPAVDEMRTLECISNPAGGPLISNAVWKAIRMKDLLSRVGVKTGTVELKLESFDGYQTSIPLAWTQDDHALLAYEMNGEPLPVEHGKPLRCLWPGHYGMKQPKWLTHIEAITQPFVGFWESQGWSNEAPIRPSSRINKPEDNATLADTSLAMSGIGFSGAAGIAKIEVSWNNGKSWQPADLVRGPTPYVWTQWSWSGPVPQDGEYTLLARVTDNAGDLQSNGTFSLLGDTFPNGTAGMQPVVITVKKG